MERSSNTSILTVREISWMRKNYFLLSSYFPRFLLINYFRLNSYMHAPNNLEGVPAITSQRSMDQPANNAYFGPSIISSTSSYLYLFSSFSPYDLFAQLP